MTGRIPHICSHFQTSTGQRKSKMLPCPSGPPPGVSLPPASPHQHLASPPAWGPPAAPTPLPAHESLPSAGDGGCLPRSGKSERTASVLFGMVSVDVHIVKRWFSAPLCHQSAPHGQQSLESMCPTHQDPVSGPTRLPAGVPCSFPAAASRAPACRLPRPMAFNTSWFRRPQLLTTQPP